MDKKTSIETLSRGLIKEDKSKRLEASGQYKESEVKQDLENILREVLGSKIQSFLFVAVFRKPTPGEYDATESISYGDKEDLFLLSTLTTQLLKEAVESSIQEGDSHGHERETKN